MSSKRNKELLKIYKQSSRIRKNCKQLNMHDEKSANAINHFKRKPYEG